MTRDLSSLIRPPTLDRLTAEFSGFAQGDGLVTLWTADTGRFTRDIDFQAFRSDEVAELKEAFSTFLLIDGGDGLIYDAANLAATLICEDQVYGSLRLRTTAYLGTTQIPIIVDLGFGDALGNPKYQIDYGSCAFHGSWAPVPRDRGHSFHGIVGSHSTRRWAAGLTDGFMESGLC